MSPKFQLPTLRSEPPSHGEVWGSDGSGPRPFRAAWFFWICAAIDLLGLGLRAESFLTVDQAAALCFGGADRFEVGSRRILPDERRAIQAACGVKVRRAEVEWRTAWRGSEWLGTLMVDQVFGKHEWIDYVVALDPVGSVLQVEILVYREHYGGEMMQAEWRAQFRGKTAGAKLRINEDVYNITGATLSCRAVTEGIRRVLATYALLVAPLSGVGGVAGGGDGGRGG